MLIYFLLAGADLHAFENNPQTNAASALAEGISPRFEDFAGAESCAKCHARQYEVWKNSTHGRAGGAPNEVKMIARFDGQPIRFKDATVTPLLNAGGEPMFVLEEAGQPKFEISVDAVVGGGHMYGGGTQSFFHRFADGSMRFLPFDFIRRENLWFVQLRRDLTWVPAGDEISLHNDLANWPPHRVLGTSADFSNCQNCHGSQITLGYNEKNRKYETRYKSLRIDCESCHGPGRRHIQLMQKAGADQLEDIGMKPLATASKDQSLLVCLACHASKDALREEPYLAGASLESYFSLKLPHFEDTYMVDGRVRSFGYQGNHLYSDCYLNGSMTCVDCHDPHSQTYRDVFRKPLSGKFDNGQCTGCHASKALSTEQHSHHKPDSPGNLCTSCHMPFLQHQGVGTHLQFARSDHSIPIPRPAFDQSLGLENACQKCHRDKDISWQEKTVRAWWGELKPHPPAVATSFKAQTVRDATTAAALLLSPAGKHPMAQTAALVSFINRFVHPNMSATNTGIIERLKALAGSDDLDLRALALSALDLGWNEEAEIRSFCAQQLRASGASAQALRDRWAAAAAYRGDAFSAGGDTPNAILCFNRSLEVRPENVVTLSHLALAYLKSQNASRAIVALKKAVALQPHKAALHFQLALIYQQITQNSAAIRELEEGLSYAPDDAAANRMLQQLRR